MFHDIPFPCCQQTPLNNNTTHQKHPLFFILFNFSSNFQSPEPSSTLHPMRHPFPNQASSRLFPPPWLPPPQCLPLRFSHSPICILWTPFKFPSSLSTQCGIFPKRLLVEHPYSCQFHCWCV